MRAPLTTAAVATLAFAIALHPIVSEDLFWHLASGRWILEHRDVPRTDVLTYTLGDRPWTNLQWAGDAAIAALWRWAGADGVVLVKALAFAALAGILVAAGRAARAGPGAAAASAMFAILAGAERTFERPEVASAIFLAITVLTAIRHRAARSRALFVLPLGHAVWANVHSLAFLGPATLAWCAALTAWEERRRGGTPPQGAGEGAGSAPPEGAGARAPGSAASFAGAAAVSALALLVNPYGAAAWTFPRTLLRRISGEEAIFGRILEFESPLTAAGDPALRWFWIFAAALLVVLAAAFASAAARRAPSFPSPRFPAPALLFLALLAAPFLPLALLARRNIPLFVIAASPVLARALADRTALAPLEWRRRAALVPFAAALALTAAVLGGASPALLGLWRDRGLGVEPGRFPERALEALDESGVHGPLFNDLDFGGYVSWRDDSRKTFIDGRLEVVGPERLNTYAEAHRDAEVWGRLESSWGFEALLVAHAGRGNAAFLRARLDDGSWTLVRLDPEAALLLRAVPPPRAPAGASPPSPAAWDSLLAADRGPAPHAGRALDFAARPLDRFVRRLQRGPRIAPIRSANRWANACITVGWIGAAREGYERILAAAPRDPEALFNRGLCDLLEGDASEARRKWERALPLVDRVSRSRFLEAIERVAPGSEGGR